VSGSSGMLPLYSRICGWKSEAGSIKAPAIPTSNGQSKPNKAPDCVKTPNFDIFGGVTY